MFAFSLPSPSPTPLPFSHSSLPLPFPPLGHESSRREDEEEAEGRVGEGGEGEKAGETKRESEFVRACVYMCEHVRVCCMVCFMCVH